MSKNKLSKYSYLFSLLIHIFIAVIISFLQLNNTVEEEEYITIGFGAVAANSSSGKQVEPEKKEDEKEKERPKVEEKEKIETPKSVNEDEESVVPVKEEKKEEKKKEEKKPEKKPVKREGRENDGNAVGKYGISFDWGGKGIRKIIAYNIPEYPAGVSKEINVKLRFKINPDGSVGAIIPLIKADTRLEMAAIRSLRQWRFEVLESSKKQIDQTAIITFPFRLR